MPLYSFVKEYAGTKSKSASSVNLFRNIVLKPKSFISYFPKKYVSNFILVSSQLLSYLWTFAMIGTILFEYEMSNRVKFQVSCTQIQIRGNVYNERALWPRRSTQQRIELSYILLQLSEEKLNSVLQPIQKFLLSHVIKQRMNEMSEVLIRL